MSVSRKKRGSEIEISSGNFFPFGLLAHWPVKQVVSISEEGEVERRYEWKDIKVKGEEQFLRKIIDMFFDNTKVYFPGDKDHPEGEDHLALFFGSLPPENRIPFQKAAKTLSQREFYPVPENPKLVLTYRIELEWGVNRIVKCTVSRTISNFGSAFIEFPTMGY